MMKTSVLDRSRIKILDAVRDGDRLVEILHSGGLIPLRVTGSSMCPLLKPGRDIVWLRACTPSSLKRGRILLFRRQNGAFILHRVRRVLSGGALLMNGDAQNWCESISADSAIAAVEEFTLRGRQLSRRHPALLLWDTLWFITRPFRPQLFSLWGCFKARIAHGRKDKDNP